MGAERQTIIHANTHTLFGKQFQGAHLVQKPINCQILLYKKIFPNSLNITAPIAVKEAL